MEAFGDLRQHHSRTVIDAERTGFYHILWEYWSHYAACSAGGGVAAYVMGNRVMEDDDGGVGGCGDGALSYY